MVSIFIRMTNSSCRVGNIETSALQKGCRKINTEKKQLKNGLRATKQSKTRKWTKKTSKTDLFDSLSWIFLEKVVSSNLNMEIYSQTKDANAKITTSWITSGTVRKLTIRGQFNKETTSVVFTTAECACKFSTYNWLNPIEYHYKYKLEAFNGKL